MSLPGRRSGRPAVPRPHMEGRAAAAGCAAPRGGRLARILGVLAAACLLAGCAAGAAAAPVPRQAKTTAAAACPHPAPGGWKNRQAVFSLILPRPEGQARFLLPVNVIRRLPNHETGHWYYLADGRLGCYISETGQPVYIPGIENTIREYDLCEVTGEDYLYAAKRGGRWGYVTAAGEWAIPPQYLDAEAFHEGFARVQIAEGEYACIDTSGRERYRWRDPVRTGRLCEGAAVQLAPAGPEKLRLSVLDAEGKTLASGILIDREQEWIFYLRMMNVFLFSSCNRPEFSEGLLPAMQNGQYGYLNTVGEWAIPPQFAAADGFSQGLAAARYEDGLYGYIDRQGQMIIPPQYYLAGPFSEGLAGVQLTDPFSGGARAGQMGYIRPDGSLAFTAGRVPWPPPHNIGDYEGGYCFSEGAGAYYDFDSMHWGFVDANGRPLLQTVSGFFSLYCPRHSASFHNGIACLYNWLSADGYEMGYVTREGQLIWRERYWTWVCEKRGSGAQNASPGALREALAGPKHIDAARLRRAFFTRHAPAQGAG